MPADNLINFKSTFHLELDCATMQDKTPSDSFLI